MYGCCNLSCASRLQTQHSIQLQKRTSRITPFMGSIRDCQQHYISVCVCVRVCVLGFRLCPRQQAAGQQKGGGHPQAGTHGTRGQCHIQATECEEAAVLKFASGAARAMQACFGESVSQHDALASEARTDMSAQMSQTFQRGRAASDSYRLRHDCAKNRI